MLIDIDSGATITYVPHLETFNPLQTRLSQDEFDKIGEYINELIDEAGGEVFTQRVEQQPEEEERNMCVTRVRGLTAITVVVLALLAARAVESQAADLFTPVNDPPPAGPLDDSIIRNRVVTIDFGQLDHAQAAVADPAGRPPSARAPSSSLPAPGPTLTLNLFDDVVVTGLVERTAPTFSGGYSVSGHLLEEPLGTLTLVVNGATVAGTVRLLGETYQIRSLGDGLYAISEVEEPPFICGVEGPHAETAHAQ